MRQNMSELQMEWDAKVRPGAGKLRIIHEIALSANLAFAIVYAFLANVFTNNKRATRMDDSSYFFLRGVFRVMDLLHLHYVSPVSANRMARDYSPYNKIVIAAEICIFVTTVCITFLFFLLLRFARKSRAGQPLLIWTEGAASFFVVPAAWLIVSMRGSLWTSHGAVSTWWFVWHDPLFDVLAGEFLGSCILVVFSRNHTISTWTLSVIATIHAVFWLFVMWPHSDVYFGEIRSLNALIFSFPAAVVAWIVYCKRLDADLPRPQTTVGFSARAAALVSLATLLLIWSPNVFAKFSARNNGDGILAELSRGGCYGSCPSYTIKIHGNGLVEYTGKFYVGVQGPQTENINSAQVAQVMQSLAKSRLDTLDDRAFAWCFDTASVALALTVYGKTRRVDSDSFCVGSKSGVQANFVKAAAEIDQIVGSARWVHCDRDCKYQMSRPNHP